MFSEITGPWTIAPFIVDVQRTLPLYASTQYTLPAPSPAYTFPFDRATGDFCGGTTIEEQSLQEYINHYNAIKISDLDAYMRGALPYQDDFDSDTIFEEYYSKCAKTVEVKVENV